MGKEQIKIIGDNHFSTSIKTPLLADAFDTSDDEKIKNIQHHFKMIMQEMGLDLTDDSLSGTPYRVAKMYVKELFYGLNPANKPKLSIFENKYGYKKMLIEQNITIDSACEHHFLPFIGTAHVAYLPKNSVVGLSKIPRIVDHFAKQPQVQERLTNQIAEFISSHLDAQGVGVIIESEHSCMTMRGVKKPGASMVTSKLMGSFKNDAKTRSEFLMLCR